MTADSAGRRPSWVLVARWIAVIGVTVVLATPPATSIAASATSQRPATPSQVTEADDARLELIEQRFAIDPNGEIQLRYLLSGLSGDPLGLIPPESTTPPITDPDAPAGSEPVPVPEEVVPDLPALTIEVINYTTIDDPADAARLVGSDVDPDAFGDVGDVVDGVAIDARPLMTRNDDGTVDLLLDIGTDVVDSVETRLKLERPGIYPLRIQLLLGDPAANNVIATAGTLIQRVAGAIDANVEVPPPINLSVVTVTPGPPPGADSSTLAIARSGLDEAIELAATLDVPVTLEVPPTLIADLAATPEGSERLATSLAGDELVALPIVPLDVSSAAAVDGADTYARLVSSGEDMLFEAAPTTPSRRDVWVSTDPLSAGGAQLLRDLGTRFVVIPAPLYEDTITGDLPPSDRFVNAELPDGSTMPLLVVDPLASQLTTDAADRILTRSTPIEWGIATIAEMLIAQANDDAAIESATSPPDRSSPSPRRSRVLTTPDLASPDARLLTALEQIAETTPAVHFTAASELAGVTDVLLDRGQQVTVQLPDVAGPSLDARVELITRTQLQLASAASMLPDGDPRVDDWSSQVDTLISTGYSDAEAEAIAAELVAEAETFKDAVELPEPFRFTLTGSSGTIEVRIRNTLDEPLDVIVALSSEKVAFPEGDQRVTLRALDETSVIVPVEAESNGTSSIALVVSTPAGEALGEPVTLTARVTALTGLGQVLTAGFVLVLLTWWFTNWRGRRRSAVANDGRGRHPSTGKVESGAL